MNQINCEKEYNNAHQSDRLYSFKRKYLIYLIIFFIIIVVALIKYKNNIIILRYENKITNTKIDAAQQNNVKSKKEETFKKYSVISINFDTKLESIYSTCRWCV
jgi:hypothetical protein